MLIALLVPTLLYAQPYSAKDQKKEKAAVAAMTKAAATADEAPPCDGLDRFEKQLKRYKPSAKACPLTMRYFNDILVGAKNARKNCRDTMQLVEGALKDPELCRDKTKYEAVRTKMNALRNDGHNQLGGDLNEPVAPPHLDPKKHEGELKNVDCEIAVLAGMEFLFRANQQANKHYGKADYNLDVMCDADAKSKIDYPVFAHKGERGMR